MTKSPYTFEVFDSRNTSTTQKIPLAQSNGIAREIAKRLSLRNHHVIVYAGHDWEEYKKAERVTWSYPAGLAEVSQRLN